jgi:hypothetical protein
VDDQGRRSILAGKYELVIAGAQPGEATSKAEATFTVNGSLELPK